MNCSRERRCAAARIAAVFLLLGPSVTGWTQDAYPSRPVRLIVPFPPGGSTDNLARVVVPRLIPVLQQQVIIDNRGGAASNIGTDMVAKAAPDGYTVGLFDTAFVINPTLYAKLPFDPRRDFRAVMVIATGPSVLVVHPSLGVSTVKELIALAKAKPGVLTFASAGAGTAIHLSGEMLKVAAGINLLHVPYKGAGPAITDVVAGQVHMMFAQPGTVLGQVNTNRMRAIAMNSEQRWSGMPNVPTFAEAGVAGATAASRRCSWRRTRPPRRTGLRRRRRRFREVRGNHPGIHRAVGPRGKSFRSAGRLVHAECGVCNVRITGIHERAIPIRSRQRN